MPSAQPDPAPWLSLGFRELKPGVLVHPDEPYARAVIGTTYEGRTSYVPASLYELASWVFPHEPEEDGMREALARDLVEAIGGRADPDPLTGDIRTLVERFRYS